MDLRGRSSREMVKMVENDGWYHVHTTGDHKQYKHPTKKGRVTIPHPKKDLPIKTVDSILKQAGLK
ncbi:addiction module toxin, HicA family [Paenibacillus sp. FSL A5-0031]|uniref:type II toxin-antitoxin system HicA family toxin n=1 Tax=Paenibacillus sp. FSL A5-0031 TaxID=1920420 RepID=UPI00096F43D4|nr:type II toxin-antitoxin system HicA family toxin [Paenibacillus sp. FSL A5-0031]OME86898.1 addiction module toxin, HicA family [Paenibacillus sp. FSL A5-0031]